MNNDVCKQENKKNKSRNYRKNISRKDNFKIEV